MQFLVFCIVAFSAIAVARADIGDTVNIQFKAPSDGLYAGTGAAGGGTLWNACTGAPGTDMRDLQTAAGKRSPVDFAASYLAKFGGSPITGADASVLLGKGLYGTVTFTFSDLDPLDTFSLYVYVGNKAEVQPSALPRRMVVHRWLR